MKAAAWPGWMTAQAPRQKGSRGYYCAGAGARPGPISLFFENYWLRQDEAVSKVKSRSELCQGELTRKELIAPPCFDLR